MFLTCSGDTLAGTKGEGAIEPPPDNSIVARRLLPPQLPRDIVERARLTGLDAALSQFRLVLVHAPAGSGKTTLLS